MDLHVPPVKDPFKEGYFVAQATHPLVNKGQALQSFKSAIAAFPPLVIAAGDDENDRSLLAVADVKIVMGSAPYSLLKIADIVAPPATEDGIIAGLETALRNWVSRR